MARAPRPPAKPRKLPAPAAPPVVAKPKAPTPDPLQEFRQATIRLATRAEDQLANLRQVQRAYICLERLVCPSGPNDDERQFTQGEMSAMVTLLNAELEHRVASVDAALKALKKG